jgi:hypothetical protein
MAAAELTDTYPTLYDLSRIMDPRGGIAQVAETIAQTNEIMDDIPWIQCNDGTRHLSSIRTGYPEPTWRKYYQGVQPSKTTTRQVADTCGMLSDYSVIDAAMARINNNSAAWRRSEEKGFIQGFGQALAYALLYSDSALDPEQILGLSPRFDTPSADEDEVGSQLIDGGAASGQTDLTSVWLIGWGPESVFGTYPNGSQAGLQIQDKGLVTVGDETNGYYEALRTYFEWSCGLVVKDWGNVVRLCNLDVSGLATAGTDSDTSANLIMLMLDMIERVRNWGNADRWAFYANRRVRTALRKQLINRSNTLIALEKLTGPGGIIRNTLTFDGIPVRRVDKLGIAETQITGTFWS